MHTKVRGRNRLGAHKERGREICPFLALARLNLKVKKSARCHHLTNVRGMVYNHYRARPTHSKKGNKVRYEFQIIKTVEIDSKNLKLVSSEEEALEMLKNGWGVEVGEQEIRLVHVGHGMDK